jgi:hypothetical protein
MPPAFVLVLYEGEGSSSEGGSIKVEGAVLYLLALLTAMETELSWCVSPPDSWARFTQMPLYDYN